MFGSSNVAIKKQRGKQTFDKIKNKIKTLFLAQILFRILTGKPWKNETLLKYENAIRMCGIVLC